MKPVLAAVHFSCFNPLSMVIDTNDIPDWISRIPVKFIVDQFAWFWINLAMFQGHGREFGFKLLKREGT
ncbi:MAG: hypothetical protein KFF73_00485 [Cyclobacteriaceae bacterium]|nr:hypothetical protein [Cyclobacteriaceae bacterium]